jgi:hypothetical protein
MVCNGATELYSVPAVPGATTYTWTLPSGWSGASVTENISTTSNSSSGSISVTADNSCGSSPASLLPVTVNTFTPTLTLSNDSLVCTTGMNYQWYLDNNLIGGAADYFYLPAQNGNYFVTVTDANGCTGTTPTINLTTVGISNIPVENSFFTYPNPATNRFNISVNDDKALTELNIFDETGRNVKHITLQKGENTIDIFELPEGYYNTVIGNEIKQTNIRLLIAR